MSLHFAHFPGLSSPLCFLTTYCLWSGLLTCFYNELRARVSVGWTGFFFFFCTDLSFRYQKFDAWLFRSYKNDDNIIHQAFNPVLGIMLCPLNILSYFINLIRRWQGEKKCTSSKRGSNIFGDIIFLLVKVIGDIEWGIYSPEIQWRQSPSILYLQRLVYCIYFPVSCVLVISFFFDDEKRYALNGLL